MAGTRAMAVRPAPDVRRGACGACRRCGAFACAAWRRSALFAYVRVYPIARSVELSFYKWNLIGAAQAFVGWTTTCSCSATRTFLLALRNTTVYSVATVVISTVLALPLAVFLARPRAGSRRSTRPIYFLPVITPMVPMAIAWKWIYDYNYGLLNYALSLVGLPPVAWLTDPTIALWALVIMGVWKVLGYNLILFLVGIRNIPAQLSRGRRASTAPSTWQQFCHVTLPLLRPILLYVLVTATINAFNVFTQVYVMTLGSQAAPGQAVRVLVFDIYQNAFQYFRMGYASAEAVTLTLIVLGFTLIQFRFVREQESA